MNILFLYSSVASRQVLPDDMIVLAEPNPYDMVQAIKKAIHMLPYIDPHLMHDRMKSLYSWHDVAKRTEVVYNRARQCSKKDFLYRLSRYLRCGTWAGKIFFLVMLLNFLLLNLLQIWQPSENIEEVPDMELSLDQQEDKPRNPCEA